MMMIAGGIIALILIIVIIIVIRRKRNKAYAEEFSGIPFAGMNDEDYNVEYDSNEYDDYNQEEIKNDDYSLTEETDKDDSMNEEGSYSIGEIQEDNNREEIDEKERAKREFLNGYNSDNEDYFEEEKNKRRRKGKRFK